MCVLSSSPQGAHLGFHPLHLHVTAPAGAQGLRSPQEGQSALLPGAGPPAGSVGLCCHLAADTEKAAPPPGRRRVRPSSGGDGTSGGGDRAAEAGVQVPVCFGCLNDCAPPLRRSPSNYSLCSPCGQGPKEREHDGVSGEWRGRPAWVSKRQSPSQESPSQGEVTLTHSQVDPWSGDGLLRGHLGVGPQHLHQVLPPSGSVSSFVQGLQTQLPIPFAPRDPCCVDRQEPPRAETPALHPWCLGHGWGS